MMPPEPEQNVDLESRLDPASELRYAALQYCRRYTRMMARTVKKQETKRCVCSYLAVTARTSGPGEILPGETSVMPRACIRAVAEWSK